MNTFGFLLSNLGKKLGMRRPAAWRASINREHHLVKTTEQALGEQAWQEIEEIEELTIEYWEIKDIENQQAELEKRNRTLEAEIEIFRNQREEITKRINKKLERKRDELIDKTSTVDSIATETEQAEHEKRVIEKRFEALKLKRKILMEQDGTPEESQAIYDTLKELKVEHTEKKRSLAAPIRASKEAEQAVAATNGEINALQDSIREETADVTEEFNQLSRRVAQNRSRIGALELTKGRALVRIGRYLGLHQDDPIPETQAVCSNHRDLVSRIVRLRRSINFHRRLAEGK
jgi:chromosome segregation ATPase